MKVREGEVNEASTTLVLPAYVGDGMVVQQGVSLCLLGRTDPGLDVMITLERLPLDDRAILPHDTRYGVIHDDAISADEDGYFDIHLPALDASYEPYRLTVSAGDATRVYNDVAVGEVWLSGGGAHMAMPVVRTDVLVDDDALGREAIRLFQPSESGLDDPLSPYAYDPQDTMSAHWVKADDGAAFRTCSAVAYAFAEALHDALDVPIGLVNVAASGTYAHSWLKRECIEDDPLIKGRAREVKQYRDKSNWNAMRADQIRPEVAGVRRVSPQIRRPQMALSQPIERQFEPKNQPSVMYNHKLAPLTGLALRGVLWYPNENELDAPESFRHALIRLTEQLESLFTAPEGRLAFVYAQMPAVYYPHFHEMQIALFNEMLAQVRRSLALPSGYVTCYDVPLDYEQPDPSLWDAPHLTLTKRPIGHRMAHIALGLTYGHDTPSSAPEPAMMEAVGNKLMLDFSHVGRSGTGLALRTGEVLLKGFAVAGPDRVFVPAQARLLHGVQVMVWHDEIEAPCSLTYAMATFNQEASLVSAEGLPATPFRIDRTPSRYAKPMPFLDCDQLEGFVWPKPITSIRRALKHEWPGVKPLWTVSQGRATLALDHDTVRWGRAAIAVTYKNADSRPVCFGPVLTYASSYPPFDLSLWRTLELHLFSVDHPGKTVTLELGDEQGHTHRFEPVTLDATYRYQMPSYDLSKAASAVRLTAIVSLTVTIEDKAGAGMVRLDRIALRGVHVDRA